MTDLQSVADRGLLVGVPLPTKTGKERARVKALLEEMGCDPFRVLAHIAMGNHEALGVDLIELSDMKDAAKELAGYLAPKLRAIEHVDTAAISGGVMLIPAPMGSLDDWAAMVNAQKIKTVETISQVIP